MKSLPEAQVGGEVKDSNDDDGLVHHLMMNTDKTISISN